MTVIHSCSVSREASSPVRELGPQAWCPLSAGWPMAGLLRGRFCGRSLLCRLLSLFKSVATPLWGVAVWRPCEASQPRRHIRVAGVHPVAPCALQTPITQIERPMLQILEGSCNPSNWRVRRDPSNLPCASTDSRPSANRSSRL